MYSWIHNVPFKMPSKSNHVLWYKNETSSMSPRIIHSPNHSMTYKSRSSLLLGRCPHQLSKICAGVNMLYSRTAHTFTLEHYFASKSFTAAREAFSNSYPDEYVSNKSIINRLETKLWNAGSVTSTHQGIKHMKLQLCQFRAVHQLHQWDAAA
jgi:hypothetical protein